MDITKLQVSQHIKEDRLDRYGLQYLLPIQE